VGASARNTAIAAIGKAAEENTRADLDFVVIVGHLLIRDIRRAKDVGQGISINFYCISIEKSIGNSNQVFTWLRFDWLGVFT
jgi:hypothetical protein